jgi:enoyl-CoA hydratase/carnithine racemase
MSMSSHLQIARGQTHVELTLNRPECRNALSRSLISDLSAALREAGAAQRLTASLPLTPESEVGLSEFLEK